MRVSIPTPVFKENKDHVKERVYISIEIVLWEPMAFGGRYKGTTKVWQYRGGYTVEATIQWTIGKASWSLLIDNS